ncbi:penicillin acylase family protein [soil metagenome]
MIPIMTVDPGQPGPGETSAAVSGPPPPPRPRLWQRILALPRGLRVATYIGVLLVLALVVVSLTSVVLVRRSFPQTTGTLEVAGLEGPVDVLRDDAGIAQIYADSTEDLMFAQGFVAAQDRFFEMDVRRHATAGRLAELFGQDGVESDVYVRTLGWRQVAEAELPMLAPETRTALDAYAKGVNAYLADRPTSRISLEYVVLGAGGADYTPEPWTSVDSLAWFKAVAWDLGGNMQDEIDRVQAIAAVGRKRAAKLYPEYPYEQSDPIVTQGAVVDGVFEQDAQSGGTRNPKRPPTGPAVDGRDPATAAALAGLSGLAALGEGTGRIPAWLGHVDGFGSNSWVVSGDHTETGAPLLANDPHLGVSAPSPLLQVGLHCRNLSAACPYDVSGFSYSGVPGVVIGHNLDIAWGLTNLGADVTDLYVERVTGDTWRHGGKQVPLDGRIETIEVEGGDDVVIKVRSTDHGPIVSDADAVLAGLAETAPVKRPKEPTAREKYAVSLSWTGLTPSPTADAILELDRARDWNSFRQALSSFAAPAQNVVYADRDGHIGYQAAGLVPIRKSGNGGRLPSAGWRPENDWTGEYVPYDGLPNVLDPDSGVIVTANQAVTEQDYPYFLTDDWDRGYRSQRIRALIDTALTSTAGGTTGLVSVDDLAAMQLDDRNPLGPILTPYLLEAELPGGYYSDGQRLLAGWDFDQPTDSAAAAYFNVVWRNLLALTFDDELPESLWPDGGQRWFAVMTGLLADPDNAYWDDITTDVRETRDTTIVQAMRDARDELTSREAVHADEWTWGGLHELDLRSQMMGDRGLGWLFNRGGGEAAGGGTSVNATSWDAAEGYDVTVAPSMRMVVSLDGRDGLEGFDASQWINLTGVSGHAFDAHYTDQTERWLDGLTLPWAFTEEAVREAADDTLVLTPDEG